MDQLPRLLLLLRRLQPLSYGFVVTTRLSISLFRIGIHQSLIHSEPSLTSWWIMMHMVISIWLTDSISYRSMKRLPWSFLFKRRGVKFVHCFCPRVYPSAMLIFNRQCRTSLKSVSGLLSSLTTFLSVQVVTTNCMSGSISLSTFASSIMSLWKWERLGWGFQRSSSSDMFAARVHMSWLQKGKKPWTKSHSLLVRKACNLF